MDKKYSIPLSKLINEFNLSPVYLPEAAEKIVVKSPELSRPGLLLAGFYDQFDPDRIQVIGRAEHAYLDKLPNEEARTRYEEFVALNTYEIQKLKARISELEAKIKA